MTQAGLVADAAQHAAEAAETARVLRESVAAAGTKLGPGPPRREGSFWEWGEAAGRRAHERGGG